MVSVSYSDRVTPNVSAISYDGDGQRIAMSEPTGISHWAYDSLHRLTSAVTGSGATVGYGYDLLGQITSIAYPNAKGSVTRAYDPAGRLTSVSDWAGRTTSYSYDADANPITQVYPNATTASMAYDHADQVSSIAHAPSATAGSPFASFSYTHDPNHLMTKVASTGVPPDSHSYGYDALNQLSSVDASPYGYDHADNPTNLAGATQSFDKANQVSTHSGATQAITLVGNGSGGDDGSTAASVALPAGIQAGDQILLATTESTSATVSAPAGYVKVSDNTYATAMQRQSCIERRPPAARPRPASPTRPRWPSRWWPPSTGGWTRPRRSRPPAPATTSCRAALAASP